MNSAIDVSIVIVNYNVKDLIKNCINSIYKSMNNAQINFEIIVVDNNSFDDSVKMIKTQFQQVILIENKFNNGFPAANNQGFKISRGKFIFMLNPDTEIVDQCITQLYNFMLSNDNYALIAPKLLNTNLSHQSSTWKFPSIYTVFAELFHLNFLLKEKNYLGQDFEMQFEADSYSGAALFFKKSLFETIGVLDENLFWIEDIDFCYRIKKANLKMLYYPKAKVIHHIGQSAKKNYNISISNQIYNKIKYFKKHHSKPEMWLIKLISFFGVLFKIVTFSILAPFKEVYFLKLKAYLYTIKRVFNPPLGIQ